MSSQWPLDPGAHAASLTFFSSPAANVLGRNSTLVPITPPSSSGSSQNEMFSLTSNRSSTSSRDSEVGVPSSLTVEPTASEMSTIQPDWRRFEPPRELLNKQEATSPEIRDLLAPSIERMKTRYAAEEERRVAAAREDWPLTPIRTARTPEFDLSIANLSENANSAGGISVSSNDSGYGSQLPSPSVELSAPLKSRGRKSFDLSLMFKRKTGLRHSLGMINGNGEASTPPRQDIPIPRLLSRRPVPVPEPSTGECVSCLDSFATSELIKLTCHNYCHDCFQGLVNTALESETHWPVKCCLNIIPVDTIRPHISTEMKIKYNIRHYEWGTPAGERIYCPQPNCTTWIPPSQISKERHLAKCPTCQHRICTTCRGDFHNGRECPQDANLQATINLAEMEGWKRCYSCNALVEHNQGCRHMTCRCKAQFCYICGLRWRTCACTDAQLTTIQQQVVTRRRNENAREARARADAEEERIVLQMVADFEREEAERLAREAEVQRRREEEERRRLEDERIAAVNLRFHHLTMELETLHDVQRVLVAERHEFETEVLKKDRQDALDTLAVRHASEIQVLGVESQKKTSDSEYKVKAEYQVRLAEERRIEDQYVDDLRAYWTGKPEGEVKIKQARDELRTDRDKEYQLWNTYRRKQLAALVDSEKRKMDALKQRHGREIVDAEVAARNHQKEWRVRVWAERKWAEEVLLERSEMLQAMELEEYGRGT